MLTPNSFAFHVTYTCPLRCAHCCFHAGPENKFRLPLNAIIDLIDALDDDIEMVAFTGGEPFLLGDDLVKVIERAAGRGFVTRVVTSAYFGANRAYAGKRLLAVKRAGLCELSISWDDFHESYVEFSAIRNVYEIGRELGLTVAINIVQSASSIWSAARVRAELGLSENDTNIICESPLNRTGRASEELNGHEVRHERLVGPCPYVLTGPTMSAKGNLLACCGVIPNHERLTIAQAATASDLPTALKLALSSTLLNWLYLRGPYDIVRFIGSTFNTAVPGVDAIGGNCEACAILFGRPEITSHLDEAVALKADELAGELSVLDALGWLDPRAVLSLWNRADHLDIRSFA
jgi:uncharacterized Fe-S cluster-containing radical SAM superfamily protein